MILGCHDNARSPFFRGTPQETRTCPRRQLLRAPDAAEVLRVYGSCEGRPGVAALAAMSTHAVDALAVIDDARAQRAEWDAKEREQKGAKR